jgi:hypothetical protein
MRLQLAAAGLVLATSLAGVWADFGRSTSASAMRESGPLTLPPSLTLWMPQEKESGRVSVVKSPGRARQLALRLEVKPGDTDVAGSGSDAERADAMIGATLTDAVEGREQWWAWSTYFPSGYRPTPSTAWNLFLDFHNTGESGQANINFLADSHFDPPQLQMTVYGGASADSAPQSTFRLGPARRNQWYDFALHVVWSSNPRVGSVELFLNGRRIVKQVHRATLYAGQGAYLKLANYREAGPQPSAVLAAGVRRVESYAAAVRSFAPYSAWARAALHKGLTSGKKDGG